MTLQFAKSLPQILNKISVITSCYHQDSTVAYQWQIVVSRMPNSFITMILQPLVLYGRSAGYGIIGFLANPFAFCVSYGKVTHNIESISSERLLK